MFVLHEAEQNTDPPTKVATERRGTIQNLLQKGRSLLEGTLGLSSKKNFSSRTPAFTFTIQFSYILNRAEETSALLQNTSGVAQDGDCRDRSSCHSLPAKYGKLNLNCSLHFFPSVSWLGQNGTISISY
jgi:hypothetical protein